MCAGVWPRYEPTSSGVGRLVFVGFGAKFLRKQPEMLWFYYYYFFFDFL